MGYLRLQIFLPDFNIVTTPIPIVHLLTPLVLASFLRIVHLYFFGCPTVRRVYIILSLQVIFSRICVILFWGLGWALLLLASELCFVCIYSRDARVEVDGCGFGIGCTVPTLNFLDVGSVF